jgi:hypothetical protein
MVGWVEGITNACKTAIWAAGSAGLRPSEVRDRITALGVPEEKNLLASVHTILKRLDGTGEIKALPDGRYRRMTLGDRIAGGGRI